MGVDIWTDTVVVKHNGKFYPFWRLADNNLFEYGYNDRLKRAQEWIVLADHDPARNLWGIPEDTPLDKIKEIAERFFLGLLPNYIWKNGETNEAMKRFGFYSGIYYNSLGNSGDVSLRRYVNRIARAFQRAVTVEQLVCEGRRDCDEDDQKLINSVKSDLNMLPNFEFIRTNEEAKKGMYRFLDGVSRRAAGWKGKDKVERFIARNFFKKETPKDAPKYGVEVARYRNPTGNPMFTDYVSKRTSRKIYVSPAKTYPYRTFKSAAKVVDEINSGRYPDIIAARLVIRD